jgi:hypothetical protein
VNEIINGKSQETNEVNQMMKKERLKKIEQKL